MGDMRWKVICGIIIVVTLLASSLAIMLALILSEHQMSIASNAPAKPEREIEDSHKDVTIESTPLGKLTF